MPNHAAVDGPFGFQPWEKVIEAHLYSVVTSNATSFFVGDPVKQAGIALLTPHHGYLMQVVQHAAGAASLGVGVVIGCYDHKMKPLGYIPASTTGNSTIAGYVMVADNVDQLYIVQEDGGSGCITADNVGLNVDAVNVASGSVNTFLSGFEIDGHTAASTATLAFKIVGVHPEDTPVSASTTTGTHCRFIVKMNTHISGLGGAS